MALLKRVFISANVQCRRSFLTSFVRLSKKQNSSSSSDSESSSDDEKKIRKQAIPKTENQKEAKIKLNALLEAMIKEDPNEHTGTRLNLAKPREKERQKHLEEKEKKIDHQKFGEKLAGAAKEAAEDLGGDVKQTEAELLTRLLYKSKQEGSGEEEKYERYEKKTNKDDKNLGSMTLNELLAGMKIDRSQPKSPISQLESRADQVRSVLSESRRRTRTVENREARQPLQVERSRTNVERVAIFGADPLSIFTDKSIMQEQVNDVKLETWDRCHNRELRLAVTQPPTNIYEQMILWTNKGMLWHFPIDNEQGLEEEKKCQFYEHVHLERHLEGWCPDIGPIRHFMELVCVGLSKNPWLTVDEKMEHIVWYKDYFQKKAKLIKEIGAGEIKVDSEASQL